MSTMPLPTITVTDLDFQRLQAIIVDATDRERDGADTLYSELERAKVVPSKKVPATVLTMNSRVLLEDTSTNARREVTLVYPQDADAATGKVSVLSPLGCALIGLSAGQTITWEMPKHRPIRVRAVEILFQPEANGQFDL